MGGTFSYFKDILSEIFFEDEKYKIVIIGISNSGKSTMLSIGFNMEEVKIGEEVNSKGIKIQAWDLGGQDSIIQYWSQYFDETTPALIYVVDASDPGNFYKSKKALFSTIEVNHYLTIEMEKQKRNIGCFCEQTRCGRGGVWNQDRKRLWIGENIQNGGGIQSI